MSKLTWISAFIAVVEENGFAAAARKQGISPAAISRQVAHLESELKTELMQRTTRKITLTEIGERYYQQCKKTLGELAEAEKIIAGSQSEATGVLTVTSNRYFAIQYLIPRLAEFMQKNPKLKIKFELAERFPNFALEQVDVLFGVSMEGAPELIRKRVAVTRYVLCAAPKYLKKYGTPKTPADLSKHRYIAHMMRKPDNVITLKDNRVIYVEPNLWLNDSHGMRECAIQNLGIIKTHDYVVNDALQEGRLVEILGKFQEPQIPVYLYYQQSRYVLPKIRRFIDFFTEG